MHVASYKFPAFLHMDGDFCASAPTYSPVDSPEQGSFDDAKFMPMVEPSLPESENLARSMLSQENTFNHSISAHTLLESLKPVVLLHRIRGHIVFRHESVILFERRFP